MKQLSEICNDPRTWGREEVEAVKEYCRQQGGKRVQILPKQLGVSPVYADLMLGGVIVYYWKGKMQYQFYFDVVWPKLDF